MFDILLALDVGNSRVKAGWFSKEELRSGCPRPSHTSVWRHGDRPLLDGPTPGRVVIGAVARSRALKLTESLPPSWPTPRMVGPGDFPIRREVLNPETVGVDRLADAVAAMHLGTGPVVIADVGTCVTVDLAFEGAFRGGAIFPGRYLMKKVMAERTEALPDAPNEDPEAPPILGRDTAGAIASGTYWGVAGAISTLSNGLAPENQPVRRVLTGGGAPALVPALPSFDHVSHLTLSGLAIAAREAVPV